MFPIQRSKYLEFLSKFGISGAHPGGFPLTKEVLKQEKLTSQSVILDVGCGTGQTAAYIAKRYGAKVIGMDISPTMIEKAKKRVSGLGLPVEMIHGSIEQSPFQNASFDLILSESVLAFVHKPTALKEIQRLLKKNGRFIANELTINAPLSSLNKEEIKQFYGFQTILLEQEWKSLLTQTGFKNILIRKKTPTSHSHDPVTEFYYSDNIEPELYAIMFQHFDMMDKYKGILDSRIYSCTN